LHDYLGKFEFTLKKAVGYVSGGSGTCFNEKNRIQKSCGTFPLEFQHVHGHGHGHEHGHGRGHAINKDTDRDTDTDVNVHVHLLYMKIKIDRNTDRNTNRDTDTDGESKLPPCCLIRRVVTPHIVIALLFVFLAKPVCCQVQSVDTTRIV
jgi:hypothetical protein